MALEQIDVPVAIDGDSLRASFGLDDGVLDDVRAVGASLGHRVPEMIEDFYAWLLPRPEFREFFTTERLLVHVKAKQTEYWRDFLRAVVDNSYVHRRRIVGEAHARIELGLLSYMQAMEFVSSWLRREIEADERLAGRPSAALSVRKLIEFDSAVVVDTYAGRTAGMLERQRKRLEHVAEVMQAVTEGDLSHQIDTLGQQDVLGTSLNDMVDSLRKISAEMALIAGGDLSTDFPPRSDKDELGVSLQAMIQALRKGTIKNEQHRWLFEAEADLGETMSGNPTVGELSQRVLSQLCRALDAQVGAQYVLEDDESTLRLMGTYATHAGDGVRDRWRLGDGLVGLAAEEKRRILVSDVPDDALRIRWGFGEAVPRHVVVFPVLHEGEVRGIIEIGTLHRFSELHLQLLERSSPRIGLAISAAGSRAQVQQLLEESQAQSEELSSQQDELRQINDRLAEQTSALEGQKENLLAAEAVLRQKAAELERASRYKSEFLANMSHELRTPLNSSLILAKLFIENRQGNLTPEQIKYAENIYSSGNDLLELINDILDLSKVEAGKIELNVEPVSITRIVDGLRHRFDPLASQKQLEFSIGIDPDCPNDMHTDLQRVQQILTNLLSNAIKFTETGAVRLNVVPEGPDMLAFTVEDTGIGVPPEYHEMIFAAFRQADGTTNRKFGGTGLGLAISRELAVLLGGEIRLRSTPGKGSAFTLRIPYRSPTAGVVASAPVPPRAAAPPSLGETKVAELALHLIDDDRDSLSERSRVVLVVEDDPAFAEIVRDLARELGFRCIVAGGAEAGLRLAREYDPVAVVLDMGLPDQSGLTVLELMKRDPATRHVPIHVISVHDYQRVAREMGAVGYALKPLKREQLESAFRLLEEQLYRDTKSVLIVEDDDAQRSAIIELIAADGVDVVAMPTADEALAALRDGHFDCVVLDLMLPEVSGFELLDRMAEDAHCAFPPVIVYTARALTPEEESRLRRLSRSIIVKGARSPDRLLEEVTLFLHQIETDLPVEKQRMLKRARDREIAFEGRRVLLVEDDVRNVFALTSMLEPKGLAVDIARNGKEALARLEHGPAVDLVLMDIMMPEMDGLEATTEIRKSERWRSLPIIALTAKAMPDDRHQCLAAGANDYIAKPIDVDKLLSLVRVWIPK